MWTQTHATRRTASHSVSVSGESLSSKGLTNIYAIYLMTKSNFVFFLFFFFLALISSQNYETYGGENIASTQTKYTLRGLWLIDHSDPHGIKYFGKLLTSKISLVFGSTYGGPGGPINVSDPCMWYVFEMPLSRSDRKCRKIRKCRKTGNVGHWEE